MEEIHGQIGERSSVKDVLAKTDFLDPPPVSNIVRLEDTRHPSPPCQEEPEHIKMYCDRDVRGREWVSDSNTDSRNATKFVRGRPVVGRPFTWYESFT